MKNYDALKKYIKDNYPLIICNKENKDDVGNRENSWHICHNYFKKLINNFHQEVNKINDEEIIYKYIEEKVLTDLSCLQLGFYLANWGMMRNSFLSKFDYKIYKDVIRSCFSKLKDSNEYFYEYLFEPTFSKQKDVIIVKTEYVKDVPLDRFNKILCEIREKFKKHFGVFHHQKNISEILITKILLVIFACCPAFDTNVKKGLPNNQRSFGRLKNLIIETVCSEGFEKILNDKQIKQIDLPVMKIVDMVFFEKGKSK